MQKRRIKWLRLGMVFPLFLAAYLLIFACKTSNQASKATIYPDILTGEYSQNGGEWVPLEESTELSALEGDLVVRGYFKQDIPEGIPINYYRNHIKVTISVNGRELIRYTDENNRDQMSLCGKTWDFVISPGITTEDMVEITMHNPHSFGNAGAYIELLDHIYVVQRSDLRELLEERSIAYRVTGMTVIVFSLVMLGVSLAFAIMHHTSSCKLLHLGLFSMFAGIYILLDTADVSMWSDLVVFNTYALYLSLILALLEMGLYICSELSQTAEKVAKITVTMEEVVASVVFILCFGGETLLYDAAFPWLGVQLLICPILLYCCISEIRLMKTEKRNNIILGSFVLFLPAIWVDIVNLLFEWWPHGLLSKIIFINIFFFHFARSIKRIPEIHLAYARVQKLEKELQNSRVVLAMSQIRAHFIFNVLNAISGMCKYDPEKADETVVRFARYLRTNINIMQEDNPVTFHEAMMHLEDYVALEQIRFGDKIQFTKVIDADDFMIPPLVLQPIVENAIKHGLLPKPSGGTVLLRTWREGENVLITIQDDGVGFDDSMACDETSVGLNNVRFRLEHIMKGKMEIVSVPGKGTTVTIFIPCKGA